MSNKERFVGIVAIVFVDCPHRGFHRLSVDAAIRTPIVAHRGIHDFQHLCRGHFWRNAHQKSRM